MDAFEPSPDQYDYGAEYEHVWNIVAIQDQTAECDGDAPGADLDGVELYRDGEEVAAVAALLDSKLWGSRPCPLQAPGGASWEALKAADGVADSLNGTTVFLRLDAPMRVGDDLVIYELDGEGDEHEDCFRVYRGYLTEGGEITLVDDAIDGWKPNMDPYDACGLTTIEVDGLW